MPLPAVLGVAASVLPSIIGLIDDDAGDVADKVAGVVQTVVGTDDAIAAQAALTADPEIRLKLERALYEFQIKMAQEETKRIQTVNETMRAETQAKHWWSSAWRPFWGACSALAFVAVTVLCCMIAFDAIKSGNLQAMSQVPLIIGAFAGLFSVPGAILGIASWKRGQKQIAEVTAKK